MIIDTHCHIFNEEYENRDEILKAISKENIIIIINGYDRKTNKEAIEISERYKNVYASVGYHPSNINEITKEDFNIIEEQLNNKKVVAMGEIGLDYYHTKDNKQKQKEVFKKLIELAIKMKKPIIVHSRDSIQDVYDIMSQYKIKAILHAYSGSLEMAKEFVKLGFKLGIGGVVTFKNSNLKDVVKEIGIENIVLETDSPYLTPDPYRGKKNNPIYLKIIIKKLSEIMQMEEKKIEETTYNNSVELFDLKPSI